MVAQTHGYLYACHASEYNLLLWGCHKGYLSLALPYFLQENSKTIPSQTPCVSLQACGKRSHVGHFATSPNMRHASGCQRSLQGLPQHHSGAKGPTVFIHFLRLVGQSACHTRATTGTGVVDTLEKKCQAHPPSTFFSHSLAHHALQRATGLHTRAHAHTQFCTRLHSKHVTLLSRTAWEELAWHGKRDGLTRQRPLPQRETLELKMKASFRQVPVTHLHARACRTNRTPLLHFMLEKFCRLIYARLSKKTKKVHLPLATPSPKSANKQIGQAQGGALSQTSNTPHVLQ